MFSFRIINGQGPDNGGADGFTFVVQNFSFESPGGIGGSGGNMGYGRDENPQSPADGIPYSIAIEFDTYKNTTLNDPDNNHISVHNSGQFFNSANENASIARTSNIPNLRDGNIHTVRIEYDGSTGAVPHQWRIYFDDLTTPKLSFVKILSDVLFESGPDAWAGFTAGSAAEWENHEILSWSFSPKFPENLPGFTAPDADTVGPNPVSTPEYHPGADNNNYNTNAMVDTAVLPDRRTELWAKYYFPNNLNGGPYPLVILLHGNHSTCGIGANPRIDNIGPVESRMYTQNGFCSSGFVVAPSHRGYDYLAEKLASWGYIVVSVNANLGINLGNPYPLPNFTEVAKFPEFIYDENLIMARGRLILRHLQRLSEWNAGISPFITGTRLGTARVRVRNTREWYGMKITVGSQPVTVRSLGRIYYKGNNQTHKLKIVRVSDNVTVANTQVTMTDMTHGQIKYADLPSPVILSANTSYHIVSEEFGGGDKFFDSDTVTQTTPVATIDSAIMSINNGGSWKNPSYKLQPYGPVNFIYEANSTTPTELGVNLRGKIDFGNIGLMGHSRGGEGTRAAYYLYQQSNSPWQTNILQPMTIQGIFEFAPTDRFVYPQGMPQTPLLLNADGRAWNVVLPACDGDIFNLAGVKPFDRMLNNTSESPAKQKSVYYVYGANHNFYNTQWQESDSFSVYTSPPNSNGCVGADNNPLFLNPTVTGTGYGTLSQQKTGQSSFLAFMRGNVGSSANPNFNQNFDPRFKVPSNVSSITKIERSFTPSPSSTQTLVLHNLSFLPGSGDVCSNSRIVCSGNNLGADTTKVQTRTYAQLTFVNHDEDFNAVHVFWTTPNPNTYFQANSSASSLNVSSFQTLDFRISRRRDPSDPLMIAAFNNADMTNFSVQLVMADGTISNPVGLSKYIYLVGPVGKTNHTFSQGIDPLGELHPILRTVRVPLSDFSSVDLAQIKGVRFIFNDTTRGSINLSNIHFSN